MQEYNESGIDALNDNQVTSLALFAVSCNDLQVLRVLYERFRGIHSDKHYHDALDMLLEATEHPQMLYWIRKRCRRGAQCGKCNLAELSMPERGVRAKVKHTTDGRVVFPRIPRGSTMRDALYGYKGFLNDDEFIAEARLAIHEYNKNGSVADDHNFERARLLMEYACILERTDLMDAIYPFFLPSLCERDPHYGLNQIAFDFNIHGSATVAEWVVAKCREEREARGEEGWGEKCDKCPDLDGVRKREYDDDDWPWLQARFPLVRETWLYNARRLDLLDDHMLWWLAGHVCGRDLGALKQVFQHCMQRGGSCKTFNSLVHNARRRGHEEAAEWLEAQRDSFDLTDEEEEKDEGKEEEVDEEKEEKEEDRGPVVKRRRIDAEAAEEEGKEAEDQSDDDETQKDDEGSEEEQGDDEYERRLPVPTYNASCARIVEKYNNAKTLVGPELLRLARHVCEIGNLETLKRVYGLCMYKFEDKDFVFGCLARAATGNSEILAWLRARKGQK